MRRKLMTYDGTEEIDTTQCHCGRCQETRRRGTALPTRRGLQLLPAPIDRPKRSNARLTLVISSACFAFFLTDGLRIVHNPKIASSVVLSDFFMAGFFLAVILTIVFGALTHHAKHPLGRE